MGAVMTEIMLPAAACLVLVFAIAIIVEMLS